MHTNTPNSSWFGILRVFIQKWKRKFWKATAHWGRVFYLLAEWVKWSREFYSLCYWENESGTWSYRPFKVLLQRLTEWWQHTILSTCFSEYYCFLCPAVTFLTATLLSSTWPAATLHLQLELCGCRPLVRNLTIPPVKIFVSGTLLTSTRSAFPRPGVVWRLVCQPAGMDSPAREPISPFPRMHSVWSGHKYCIDWNDGETIYTVPSHTVALPPLPLGSHGASWLIGEFVARHSEDGDHVHHPVEWHSTAKQR